MDSAGQVHVYTDGNCPFCLWARGLVEPHDRDRRLDFCDFNRPEVAAATPFSLEELRREMYVRTPDNQWHRGYWGWVAVLRVIPRYRFLARLMSWIPFRWFGPALYRLFAANRYRMPQWLLRTAGVPRPCDENCPRPQSM